MKNVAILLAAVLMPLCAQEIKLPDSLDKLAAKADESVNVTLDSNLLKLTARFLSDKSGDEANVKKILSGLENITVRSFEFAREGQYDTADLDAIRSQLKSGPWARIVGVTSKRSQENAEVYFKDGGNGTLGGVVILCTEPTSLTIVNVIGKIDPADLMGLGGQFGIPRLDLDLGGHRKENAK